MNQERIKKLQSIVDEIVKKYRYISTPELIEKINQSHPGVFELKERTVRRYKQRAISNIESGTPEIVIKEEDNKQDFKTTVDSNGYLIKSKVHGEIHLTIDLADQLFYEFSKHGLNMTQTQIINKHGLTPHKWHVIKAQLGIYKLSNIFSPWRVSNTPKRELEKMIQDKLEMALTDKLNIENQYSISVSKAQKKIVHESQVRELSKQILITELYNIISEDGIEKVNLKRANSKFLNGGPIVVATADWHIGSRVESLKRTSNYNVSVLEGYITDMSDIVNKEMSEHVTLVINGDIIESFTGQNHKNSFMSMEFGYHGSKAIIEAHKYIRMLVSKIVNCKRVIITSGNHDRWSSDNKFDQRGEVAEIIAYMLKLSFKNNVDIVYDYSAVSIEINDINFIISHGHNRKENLKPEKLIYDYGKKNMYNLVMLAHLHSRQILHDSVDYRVVRIPSLFTGNQYSEELGYNSLAGFLIIKTGDNGKPIITDVPLSRF